jgi:hypothetical protein
MRTPKTILASLSLLLVMVGHSSAAAEPRKIDEVKSPNWEELMSRLDLLSILLQNEPPASAYIIVYDGQRSRRGEAEGWMHCIKNYLVKLRGNDANRIRIADGGYRADRTVEMWLLTAADNPPKATPTIKPKDVKFKKGRLRKANWQSLCNI